jgi:hypothetical protein
MESILSIMEHSLQSNPLMNPMLVFLLVVKSLENGS